MNASMRKRSPHFNSMKSGQRPSRRFLSRRRGMRDPMLVFNISMFNFGDGWNQIFNRLKVHENGT
jgi:hypothetical protein